MPLPRLRGLRLPSHTSGNGSEDEKDDTLRVRRRTKSAHTLPLSTIPTLELPEDPKTWSPTHLCAYLSSTLCGAGAWEFPDQATRDLIAFVKEKQILEKTLLRLNEGDLEGYVFLLPWFFPLSHIYVTDYIFLMIGLDIKDHGTNCQQPTTCPSHASCVKTSYEAGFESGHRFPVHSLQDDDFSPHCFSVDVGRRSRNTGFDSTSNGNERVKGIIAPLARPSRRGRRKGIGLTE